MEILNLKNTITEIQNSAEHLNHRLAIPEEKNELSHRGKALRMMAAKLRETGDIIDA